MTRYLFLYTCAEVISDVLHKKAFFRYAWIPREHNSTCDSLAKSASTSRTSAVTILDPDYM